uniref:p0044F08.13 protein n=1 Tax=Oryza sativa subsp. japonica TaxID=39947 RepID=Q9AWU9_ORYSJ|nr:P0044F08.13 [Oryza sativa Japonica Group]
MSIGRAAAASKARKAMVEGGTKELKASRVDEKANSDMTTDGSSYPSLQYCIVFCEFYSLQYYAAVDFASRYAGCSWGYVVWKAVDGVAAIASENQEFRIATGSTSRQLLIVRSAVEQWLQDFKKVHVLGYTVPVLEHTHNTVSLQMIQNSFTVCH